MVGVPIPFAVIVAGESGDEGRRGRNHKKKPFAKRAVSGSNYALRLNIHAFEWMVSQRAGEERDRM